MPGGHRPEGTPYHDVADDGREHDERRMAYTFRRGLLPRLAVRDGVDAERLVLAADVSGSSPETSTADDVSGA